MVHLLLLASALAAGAIAQTTSVMNLVLDDVDAGNFQGSVVSVAPTATTYFVQCAPGTNSSDCVFRSGMSVVNGPSTFGVHVTEADAFTEDVDCQITAETADCTFSVAGPEASSPNQGRVVLVGLADSLTPVTITAGLDKILAAGNATGAASTTTSGDMAQTAASASSGPSETGASASATSASGSASGPSTTASGAATGAGWNVILAGLCGAVSLVLAL